MYLRYICILAMKGNQYTMGALRDTPMHIYAVFEEMDAIVAVFTACFTLIFVIYSKWIIMRH